MSFTKNNDKLQASKFALKQTCFFFPGKRDHINKISGRLANIPVS